MAIRSIALLFEHFTSFFILLLYLMNAILAKSEIPNKQKPKKFTNKANAA